MTWRFTMAWESCQPVHGGPGTRPRQRAGVQVVQRWILAALRKRQFFSLAELNEAIAELLVKLNQRPFRKMPGSRAELYQTIDKPALQPLPAAPFVFAEWKKARVNLDYHVELEGHYYSTPYQLVGKEVEIHYTASTVEILHRGKRVASHARSSKAHTHSTLPEHRPKSHQQYLEWTPTRMIEWAGKAGPFTARLVEAMLAEKPHPEMGYRSALGVISLSRKYGPERVEAACTRAVRLKIHRYQSVKSILACRSGSPTAAATGGAGPAGGTRQHPRRRILCRRRQTGTGGGRMLNHQTMEKLHALRLTGMADAYRKQMEDAEMAGLSFEERFGLLVDQHWTWRENQAMARRLKKSKLDAEPCVEDIDFRHPRGLDRPLMRTLDHLAVGGAASVGSVHRPDRDR